MLVFQFGFVVSEFGDWGRLRIYSILVFYVYSGDWCLLVVIILEFKLGFFVLNIYYQVLIVEILIQEGWRKG